MANGCSGNSIYRFIKYVEGTGSDIEQVFADADTNGNGLKKAELKRFLDNLDPEWGLSHNDAADIFKAFNTYTSGNNQMINEDDDVQGKYEELMENFARIEDAVEEELENYAIDGISVDYIMNALAGKFDKNLNINNLQNILPKLVAQAVAVVIAENALETVAGTYDVPDGYDATKDDDLIGLLNRYINSLQGRTENIEESIEAIIEAYINGTELEDDLAPFAWNPKNGLNELQKQTSLNQVKTVVMKAESWITVLDAEALLDKAISDFIDEKLSEDPNWSFNEDLILEEFKNSKSGQVFLISTIYTDFWNYNNSDGEDTSDLYCKEIAGAFGDDFAKLLAEGDKNIPAYQNILQQVAKMVKNGEVEPDKAVQKIIQLIAENYTAIGKALGLGSDMPVDKAYTLFTNTYDEGNGELEVIKANAIRFLDAASAYNNSELNTVIRTYFGEKYADTIKEIAVPSIIKEGVKAVKDKYDELVNAGSIIDMDKLIVHPTGNAYGNNDSTTTFVGGAITGLDVSMTIEAGKVILTNSPDHQITYHATANGFLSDVSITNDGKLSFKADTKGEATITVDVLVNGKVVGTQNVTVKIIEIDNDVTVESGYTLQYLLNSSGRVSSANNYYSSVTANENNIVNCSNTIIDNLANAFKKAGYPEDAVKKAQDTMKSYYSAILRNYNYNDNDAVNYTDSSQITYHDYIDNASITVDKPYVVTKKGGKSEIDELSDYDTGSTPGIYIGKTPIFMGDDEHRVFFDLAKMAKVFKDFLNRALAS